MSIKAFHFASWLRVAALVGVVGGGSTQAFAAQIIYSQDPTLSDFTDTVSTYATFSDGNYTPTTAILLGSNYPRVVGNTSSPIYASFANPTASIVAFDNIDHLGNGWDVFQYKIYGSTDGTNYTLLFDPISVNEANQDGQNIPFTLNAYTGTAPTLLNDTVTPGLGSYVGNIGYEEYFTFASSYQYFEFAPSTLTLTDPGGENETELSAVGVAIPSQTIISTAAPEPASLMLLATGFGVLLPFARRRKSKAV